MGKLAEKYVNKYLSTLDDYELKQDKEFIQLAFNMSFDDLKKRNIIFASTVIGYLKGDQSPFMLMKSKEERHTYYNEDGTLNDEVIEARKSEYKDILENRMLYEKLGMINYEELQEYYRDKMGLISQVEELTGLFTELNCSMHNLKVYERNNGNLVLCLHFWDPTSYNLTSFSGGKQVGIDIIVNQETFWPKNDKIIEMHRQAKAYVSKELENYAWHERGAFSDYGTFFEYRIGTANFIKYYMKQLPEGKLEQYKSRKWDFGVILTHLSSLTPGAYFEDETNCMDMLIDYESHLVGLEESEN